MVVVKVVKDGEVRRLRGESLTWADVVAYVQRTYGGGLRMKYVDEDGDEVSVDSEGEFQEALTFAGSGVLRLLVLDQANRPSSTEMGRTDTERTPSPMGIAKNSAPTEPVEETCNVLLCSNVSTPVVSSTSQEAMVEKSPAVDTASRQDSVEKDTPIKDFQAQSSSQDSGYSADTRPMHAGITCDCCGCNPICGIRYKCCQCHDFDLCEACEAKEGHADNHVLLKMKTPVQRHEHYGWPPPPPPCFGFQFGRHPHFGHFRPPPPPPGFAGFGPPPGNFGGYPPWWGGPSFAEANAGATASECGGHGYGKKGNRQNHHHHDDKEKNKAKKAGSEGCSSRACGAENVQDIVAEVVNNVAQTVGDCLCKVASSVANGPVPKTAANGQEGQQDSTNEQRPESSGPAPADCPVTGATDFPSSSLTDQQVADISSQLQEMGFTNNSVNTPYIHKFAGDMSVIVPKLLQCYNN